MVSGEEAVHEATSGPFLSRGSEAAEKPALPAAGGIRHFLIRFPIYVSCLSLISLARCCSLAISKIRSW